MVEFVEIDKMITEITEVYDEKVYPTLNKRSVAIYNVVNSRLEEICRERDKFSSNSVYSELFPFSIIYREKKSISLREKLIRNDLVNRIFDSNEEKLIDNIQNEIDDIIGLTILVDTSKYLSFFKEIFFNNEISSIKVLSSEVDSFKLIGGLNYYNIKTNYTDSKGDIKVEIQIKSAIASSFLNLQHKLIYKNNHVTITGKNNDFMLQAITPAINAIEAVIDTVEEFNIKSEDIFVDFKVKKKIEELIHKEIQDGQNWDSYIDKIHPVLMRAINGYCIRNRMRINEDNIERFWGENCEMLEQKDLYKNDEISNKIEIKVIFSIINISENFIKDILLNDYFSLKSDIFDDKNHENQMDIFNRYFKTFIANKCLIESLLLDKEQTIMNKIIEADSFSTEFYNDIEDLLTDKKLTNKMLVDFNDVMFKLEIQKVFNLDSDLSTGDREIIQDIGLLDEIDELLSKFRLEYSNTDDVKGEKK